MRSVIEIFQDGKWIAAAEFEPAGGYAATFEYEVDYVFGEKPLPISLAWPVTADRHGIDPETGKYPNCPTFLLDLVPQGNGRKRLAKEVGIADDPSNDLFLTQYGAFNPIGNLRLSTAVEFYEKRRANGKTNVQGFTLDEIVTRRDDFAEHMWEHAMISAGTTGVQGAAPKFLLSQDRNGIWYADAALEDEDTAAHWLLKLPRGKLDSDYAVLRNEAAYLHVARACGLRSYGEPIFKENMLFVARFDREVKDGQVLRLHQESLASLAGLVGFGLPISQFELIDAFSLHVDAPVEETIEFIRRDILNRALRNTDNHARNTAVQRLPDGRVQLTPVYDIAPMYMDSEVISRTCRWAIPGVAGELSDWSEIFERLNFNEAEKNQIAVGVKSFLPVIESLQEKMRDCGVDDKVIEDCKQHIATQADQLQKFNPSTNTNTKPLKLAI
jgi:serine/threonine-protein kinase HipA